MVADLADTTVPTDTVIQWMFGGLAAFLLGAVLVRIIELFQMKNQQRTVTGVAVTAGVVMSVGFSPFGTIAVTLAGLSQVVPAAFPAWVSALVAVETVIGLLFGLRVMLENGGWLAVGSFVLALIGGVSLPYSPAFGILIVILAWVLMELSPADRW